MGVGTGKSFAYHPPRVEIVAVDLSQGMLPRAKASVRRHSTKVVLGLLTVENVAYPDDTGDSVVASVVCCLAPDWV